MPGYPAQVRTNFTGLTAGNTYGFRFHEYGRAFNNCADIGDQWNPLIERDSLDRVLPYQDLTRGEINSITTDTNGAIDNQTQSVLLQNLSGYNSIIGRSVAIYDTDTNGNFGSTPIGCCVIGYSANPNGDDDDHHHHHHHSHGHYPSGYNNGYGHGYSGSSSHGHGYNSSSNYGHGHGNSHYSPSGYGNSYNKSGYGYSYKKPSSYNGYGYTGHDGYGSSKGYSNYGLGSNNSGKHH